MIEHKPLLSLKPRTSALTLFSVQRCIHTDSIEKGQCTLIYQLGHTSPIRQREVTRPDQMMVDGCSPCRTENHL